MCWFLAVAALVIGVFLGAKLEKDLSVPKNISGRLRIDTSDETPYLFLEIDGSLNNIVNSKTISLDVVLEDYLPRK